MVRMEATERFDVRNERRLVCGAGPLVSHRRSSDRHCILVRGANSTAFPVTDIEGIADAMNTSHNISTQEANCH